MKDYFKKYGEIAKKTYDIREDLKRRLCMELGEVICWIDMKMEIDYNEVSNSINLKIDLDCFDDDIPTDVISKWDKIIGVNGSISIVTNTLYYSIKLEDMD